MFSFIGGITMLNCTASGVVSCGRTCSIAPALFWPDRWSTCITVGSNESEAAEARLGALFSEVERAFFKGVHVANHQDRNKTQHAPKDRAALLDRVSVNDRPGIHKHDLGAEQDEEHSPDMKL